MENRLGKLSAANGRFTVGFLDENSYYDYHNLIMKGIHKAAQEYGVNLIRFSLFTGHAISKSVSHEALFLDSIKPFKLDALIFLGWARSLADKDIRSIFGELPLFSLGAGTNGIPSAYFPGAEYIREILLHLIKAHNCANIAFVAPFWRDNRTDIYLKTMKEFNIYNPQLYVEESDMRTMDFYDRGVRAVEILLDERKVKCDAIVSLYNDEAYAISTELKRRGIHIPEDIALTSYEDGDSGKFSNPAFTTVYFPWEELGYQACESICRQLLREQVPPITRISGRIIYRGSCGCVPGSAGLSESGEINSSDKCFEELDGSELDGIIGKIAAETLLERIEVVRLFDLFRRSLQSRVNTSLLIDVEFFIRRLDHNHIEIHSIAAVLRKILLPYFLPYAVNDMEKLVWAEDIFYQIQIMLQNKLVNASFREDVILKNIRLRLKETGQILITNFTVKTLLDSLEINLPRLWIKGCYIYLFGKDRNSVNLNDNHLEFEYSGSKRIYSSDAQGLGIHEGLGKLLKEDRPYFLSAHLLHNGEDFAGMVIFEPTYMEMGMYQTVATQITTSLNGIILFEKLDEGYRRLMDQAHKKGMSDISTGILHNIGNILNNINVTTQSLEKLLEERTINELIMANNLLESRLADLDECVRNDPKCRTLMLFYISMKESFENFRFRLQEHIARLSDKIILIDEIITAQQGYTGIKTNLSAIDLAAVLDDVIKMHQVSIGNHGIRIIRNYSRTIRAYANRTKLFHVLTNIVKNAMEAMERTPVEDRKLAISVATGAEDVFIRVDDSGSGIAPEHLEDIFAYGFSTKADGHGFGLHSCANYMTEMNGKLWAESAGTGMGATFVLQLKKQGDMINPG